VEKLQTLADFFGTSKVDPGPDVIQLEDITDSKAFALAVLNSKEFREYIINGLTLGELPSAIICRLMDHGWGKPVEHVEHTGEHGQPIEVITRVVRVIVDPELDDYVPETTVMH
jgi:hypothetical protein